MYTVFLHSRDTASKGPQVGTKLLFPKRWGHQKPDPTLAWLLDLRNQSSPHKVREQDSRCSVPGVGQEGDTESQRLEPTMVLHTETHLQRLS